MVSILHLLILTIRIRVHMMAIVIAVDPRFLLRIAIPLVSKNYYAQSMAQKRSYRGKRW